MNFNVSEEKSLCIQSTGFSLPGSNERISFDFGWGDGRAGDVEGVVFVVAITGYFFGCCMKRSKSLRISLRPSLMEGLERSICSRK